MRSVPVSRHVPRQPAGFHDSGTIEPDTRLHVCVVCLGNICRSPIGEQVLRAALADAGLADQVRVSSAGIGDWHVGQGANERTVRVLAAAGYPTDHRARQINRQGLAEVDLALAADRGHLTELRAMTSDPEKVALFRSFDTAAESDEIPDPYFGPESGFDEVLAMTVAAAPGIVEEIRRRLAQRPDGRLDGQRPDGRLDGQRPDGRLDGQRPDGRLDGQRPDGRLDGRRSDG